MPRKRVEYLTSPKLALLLCFTSRHSQRLAKDGWYGPSKKVLGKWGVYKVSFVESQIGRTFTDAELNLVSPPRNLRKAAKLLKRKEKLKRKQQAIQREALKVANPEFWDKQKKLRKKFRADLKQEIEQLGK